MIMTSKTLATCSIFICYFCTTFTIGVLGDICDSYQKHGFASKDKCQSGMQVGNALENIKQHSKNMLGIFANQGMGKLENIVGNAMAKVATFKPGDGVRGFGKFMKKFKDRFQNRAKLSQSTAQLENGFDLTPKEIAKFKIWERGVIPYLIDEYSFDKILRDRIRAILDEVNAATKVEFVEIPAPPKDEKTRFVLFINRRGFLPCHDHTTSDFTNEGVQKVILGYDCIDLKSGMAGLILTLLGVPPQHNAPNRDSFIEIVTANILPDKMHYFDKLKNDEWLFHDIHYDWQSASHYPYHKYTANGGSTIRPKHNSLEKWPVGENKPFSQGDIKKIMMLYNYISSNHKISRKLEECTKLFSAGKGLYKSNMGKSLLSAIKKPHIYLNPENDLVINKDTDAESSEAGDNEEEIQNGIIDVAP